MSNQRGNHWERRTISQIISLGTVSSFFAGTLLANPPSLPGLPGSESSVPGLNDQPKLLPVPQVQSGSSLRSTQTVNANAQVNSVFQKNGAGTSAVNIKILPGLEQAGAPTSGSASILADSNAVVPAIPSKGSDRGTVQVKMHDSATRINAVPQPAPLSATYVTSSVAVTATSPMSIENEKANAGGPVKLSIGDSGIVDLGVQRSRQDAVVNSRAPELVKPRKYSVSQPVVLAQAAELQPANDSSQVLPTHSNQVVATPVEPSLSVARPNMKSTDKMLTEATLPDVGHAENLDLKPMLNEAETPIPELPTAHASPLVPPKIARAAATASTHSSVAVIPVKPTEPTVTAPSIQPQSKAGGIGEDSVLRQQALRSKPEKMYDIESRGTYAIDTPFSVASAMSLDSNICTVFNNGNSITIAGGNAGKTRVAIASQTGETRVIEVNVLPVGQQFSRPQSEIDQVKDLIGQVFPDARVQIVSLPSGEVEVKGVTSTESDARKILELVRKVCLVPVHDRLKAGR